MITTDRILKYQEEIEFKLDNYVIYLRNESWNETTSGEREYKVWAIDNEELQYEAYSREWLLDERFAFVRKGMRFVNQYDRQDHTKGMSWYDELELQNWILEFVEPKVERIYQKRTLLRKRNGNISFYHKLGLDDRENGVKDPRDRSEVPLEFFKYYYLGLRGKDL